MTPLTLKPGAKVLTVTVRNFDGGWNGPWDFSLIDEELRKRGLIVEHADNASGEELLVHASDYAAVFVNVAVFPHARLATIHLTGELIQTFWRAFYATHPNGVFTAFGSPYLLYEQPHLPNLWLAYGHSPASQLAAVKAWFGEIEPQGQCPVQQPIV